MSFDLIEFTKYILPHLVVAGSYAKRIQTNIEVHPAKAGMKGEFAEALTDADLSIQNFIELVLLAKYPELNFFGEEYASSLNTKYFGKSSELTVLLDPIDGTRYYKDKLPHYSIIISVVDRESFLLNIIYFPERDRCYLALKNQGAFQLNSTEMLAGKWSRAIELNNNRNAILTSGQIELATKFPKEFCIIDAVRDYNKDNPGITGEDLFTGKASALFLGTTQMIDGAAFANVFREAGAYLCTWEGKDWPAISETKDWLYPSVIVANTKELAMEILEIIATSSKPS